MFHVIFLFIVYIAFIIIFIFLSAKFWDFLIKIINNTIQKKINSGKLSDKKLTTLCHVCAKPNIPFSILIGGIFYNKVLKIQKSAYYLYRQEVKKRNLFI